MHHNLQFKDIASAYVIGRRALGFKEEIPENYLKLLLDREYLEYALYCYEERKRELKENLKKETNQYKQNAIRSELKEKSMLLARLESLQGKPSWGKSANGRNSNSHYEAWQVLKSALLFPILGKSFIRDFSPLKPLLVQGKWDWVRVRSVPLEAGGRSQEGIFRTASDEMQRISLSYEYLNRSCVVIFFMKGESKREAYQKLMKGENIPASKIKGRRKTYILYQP